MKKIVIYQDVTEDGLFNGYFSDVDFDSSKKKFVNLLIKTLRKRFSKCEVEVVELYQPTMKCVEIYGFDRKNFDYTISLIEQIINEVYSDFQWVVLK